MLHITVKFEFKCKKLYRYLHVVYNIIFLTSVNIELFSVLIDYAPQKINLQVDEKTREMITKCYMKIINSVINTIQQKCCENIKIGSCIQFCLKQLQYFTCYFSYLIYQEGNCVYQKDLESDALFFS